MYLLNRGRMESSVSCEESTKNQAVQQHAITAQASLQQSSLPSDEPKIHLLLNYKHEERDQKNSRHTTLEY